MKMAKPSDDNIDLTCNNYKTIKEYFEREVKHTVKLPEKVSEDKTYPGLILDGASGVGKTQQVFALLKSQQKVVYRLLTPRPEDGEQAVYKEMRAVVDRKNSFLALVDKAMDSLESKDRDTFSVEFLQCKAQFRRFHYSSLKLLIKHFFQSVLKYDVNTKTLTYDRSISSLSDVVLFLDEVLPKDNDPKSLQRLRFLRNLGRALDMRVVLAGTAATAANMISPLKTANGDAAASRGGTVTERGWMEIEFVYRHVNLSLPRNLNAPQSYKERPWFVSLLEQTSENEKELSALDIVKALGGMIWYQKKISQESMLIWLCGPWLESDDRIPTSPFLLKPADLVRGHFFEPAFVIRTKNQSKGKSRKEVTNEEYPYFGKGFCHNRSVMGRFRIKLTKRQEVTRYWWFCNAESLSKKTNRILKEGKTLEFRSIEYCLSHCVQICLAKEPLMAVCLSSIKLENFQDIFSNLWQETLPQQTVKAVDGELNEYAMFAALQLASRSGEFMQTNNVNDMVENLRVLLRISPEDDKLPGALSITYGTDDLTLRIYTNDNIKIEFEETKMPWLIPACSKEKLKKAFDKCKGMFTGDDWNIAGLVPGEQNSRMDAKAYKWDQDVPLAWSFEFKCRSSRYSLAEGVVDLNNKCNHSQENNSHAMLIAVSGNEDSQVRVWLTSEKKLRVVLVIGCG